MAATSDAGISSVIAGIAEALVATAVGLLVAIPAVVAFNYLQRQVKKAVASKLPKGVVTTSSVAGKEPDQLEKR